MTSAFIISQILIGIAFLFDIASFQFKMRKYTLTCFMAAAALISLHFFLLGAITAGAVVGVSVFRFATALKTTDRKAMYFFLIIVSILGILTFDGFEDVLITVALMFSTFASFTKDERKLRRFMMCGTILTIIHNIIIFTPAAIALEAFFLGSNLLSYWRFYMQKNKDLQLDMQ